MSYYTCKSNSRSWPSLLCKSIRNNIINRKIRTPNRQLDACDIDASFLEELLQKQEGKCYWFGVPLNVEKHNNNDFFNPSVDRLDNSKGYVKDNIVLSSRMANYARNNLTVEEFKKHIEVLKNSFKVK